MLVEYLLVVFQGTDRAVLADGILVGVTNHILMLPPDDYDITLDGTPATTPAVAHVALSGTSPVRPCVVIFA